MPVLEGGMWRKTWPVSAEFGAGGRGHKPRKVDSQEAGKGEKTEPLA